jgi:hypothetical protein
VLTSSWVLVNQGINGGLCFFSNLTLDLILSASDFIFLTLISIPCHVLDSVRHYLGFLLSKKSIATDAV